MGGACADVNRKQTVHSADSRRKDSERGQATAVYNAEFNSTTAASKDNTVTHTYCYNLMCYVIRGAFTTGKS